MSMSVPCMLLSYPCSKIGKINVCIIYLTCVAKQAKHMCISRLAENIACNIEYIWWTRIVRAIPIYKIKIYFIMIAALWFTLNTHFPIPKINSHDIFKLLHRWPWNTEIFKWNKNIYFIRWNKKMYISPWLHITNTYN